MVQVKVWLGEGMNHYYVLSRFLISRMLTVTKIPYMKVSQLLLPQLQALEHFSNDAKLEQAVKIALEVKKYLIDNDQFDVSQVCIRSSTTCSVSV